MNPSRATTARCCISAKTKYLLPSEAEQAYRRIVKQILRVDHAGAVITIYFSYGQRAGTLAPHIASYLAENIVAEHKHRVTFRELMWPRGTHPSALLILFAPLAALLGFVTALGGANTVMRASGAMERVQAGTLEHQLAWLKKSDEALSEAIAALRHDTTNASTITEGKTASLIAWLIRWATFNAPKRLDRTFGVI